MVQVTGTASTDLFVKVWNSKKEVLATLFGLFTSNSYVPRMQYGDASQFFGKVVGEEQWGR